MKRIDVKSVFVFVFVLTLLRNIVLLVENHQKCRKIQEEKLVEKPNEVFHRAMRWSERKTRRSFIEYLSIVTVSPWTTFDKFSFSSWKKLRISSNFLNNGVNFFGVPVQIWSETFRWREKRRDRCVLPSFDEKRLNFVQNHCDEIRTLKICKSNLRDVRVLHRKFRHFLSKTFQKENSKWKFLLSFVRSLLDEIL